MLASAKWKTVSWRSGTKGRLKAQFAALRVRTADGPPQRIWDKGQQHLPGDEAWLIGEQRASGEKKYYLANLPAATDLRTLAATIKARWICEQAHQQLKEELGLLRGAIMARSSSPRPDDNDCLRLPATSSPRIRGTKKRNQRASASTNHARRTSRHRRSHPSAAVSAVPILPKAKSLKNDGANTFCQSSASNTLRRGKTNNDPSVSNPSRATPARPTQSRSSLAANRRPSRKASQAAATGKRSRRQSR